MASRSLGTLTVDLIAKVGGFAEGMGKAAREADKRFKEIERRAKIAGAAIGTALVAGAGIVANQLRNTIDQMDELSKAAQRANMPTEAFTRFAYAAELADVSIQDLQSAMGRLAKAQGDAEKATSQQARIFDALGIATRDAEGNLRSTEQVFLDFADAFQRFKGDPEILAAGMQIFGRSFQTLIPLLKDGAAGLRDAGEEAEALGLIFRDEAGAQAEQFNDDLSRLKAALRGVWVEVAQQVLPQLVELTGQFVQAAKEGDLIKNTADNIATSLRALADTAKLFFNLVDGLSQVRSGLVQIEQTLSKFSLGGLAGIGEQVRSVLPDVLYTPLGAPRPAAPAARPAEPIREMDPTLGAPLSQAEIEAQRRRLRGALGDAPKTGGAKKQREEVSELDRAYKSLNERLNEQIALYNKTGEAAKLAYELENGALKGLDEARKQELMTLAERYDAMERQRDADQAAYDLAKEETDRINRGMQDGKQLLDDLRFELELMKMTNAERATAIQLRGLEAEAVAEYGEAIAEMNRVIEAEMEAAQWMDGLRGEFQGFFEDVVNGTASIKDAFRNMLDNIASMITARIAENWVDQLFGAAGSTQSGSAGGWWSALGAIFGGGKASGGWAMPNKLYEVNERGMEMATVNGRDYLLTGNSPVEITPNNKLSMGGTTINQNFINPRMTNLQTDSQRAREEARKAQRATARA